MTSIWRDEYTNQNEVVTVSSVAADGKTVVFKESFQVSGTRGREVSEGEGWRFCGEQ